jgi:oligopeptide/dipeptide ABC transporter ATP-binding protein
VVDLDDPIGSLHPIGGTLPDPVHLPEGCAFHPRCPLATAECLTNVPPLVRVDEEKSVQIRTSACFHHDLVGQP